MLKGDLPHVSVILTTRDRPRFLPVALACYQQQSYPNRDLIVVDDGDKYPADVAAVEAVGGRIIRVETGTPIGMKLNRGVSEAAGPLCQKMDDDDWYAPNFMETLMSALIESQAEVCMPTLTFLQPYLFFDVARWELRQSKDSEVAGATLLFSRDDWEEHPFRAVANQEDGWFLIDQLNSGVKDLQLTELEIFFSVRHQGHLFTRMADGRKFGDYIRECALYKTPVEKLLPDWAVHFYKALQRDLNTAPAPVH